MASDPNLRRIHAFLAAAAVVVIVLLAASKGASALRTTGAVPLRNCDTNNNGKYSTLSAGACPVYKGVTIPKGGLVEPICRSWGSPVGKNNNRWWLYVFYRRGGLYYLRWVPDHYVDCGGVFCSYKQCRNPCCSSSSGKYLP